MEENNNIQQTTVEREVSTVQMAPATSTQSTIIAPATIDSSPKNEDGFGRVFKEPKRLVIFIAAIVLSLVLIIVG